ncbi:TPA: aspartate--tRNA ligase [Patescibacteria group bacterium]|nr:aspartate--tRNA ligase [Patescibacteria group bacterium]
MTRTLAKDTINKIGEEITLQGWINGRRDHGKIMFLDLRDRTGLVQVVSTKELGDPRPEYCVEIVGLVKKRPDAMVNPKIATGIVEVEAKKITIISTSAELPFPIDSDGYDINEEIRSKYRYLDLRRPRLNRNLKLRSQMTTFIRNYLTNLDFVEVETPILTKTTPEGARDFLVPSRLQKGKFYALPQSPQQYKQLLMVAGLERYFQFPRCFRDEDPRRDRAYGEFTQLDLEMSFVTQDDILKLTEEMFTNLVKEVFPQKRITQTPWPRIPHKQAKSKYGSDKPDLRKNKNDKDELAFAWIIDFPLFTEQSEEDFYHGSGNAKFAPSHHMFTAPHLDDIPLLDSDPMKVRGLQHDLVLNGFEVGGGSIRIHQKDVQEKVFDLIGFSKKQKKQFEHMLTAFTYGVPPHGGIAPGLDRLLMAILGEPSVREVMAYPTSASGQTSVMDAPSEASEEQLKELGIAVAVQNKNKTGSIYDAIIEELKKQGIEFKNYEHKAVYTSQEAASVRNTDIHAGAKALVMYKDEAPVILVLPADMKVDTHTFKKIYKSRNLRMATKEEVEKITSVSIGAVPPFGHIFYIPIYMEKSLRDNERIVFNAGMHTRSIEMKESDYEKIAKPIVGEFALKA